MPKFIALLCGAAHQNQKKEISPEESNTLMQEWGKWAQENQSSASMFENHPHLQLMKGNTIEVVAGLE